MITAVEGPFLGRLQTPAGTASVVWWLVVVCCFAIVIRGKGEESPRIQQWRLVSNPRLNKNLAGGLNNPLVSAVFWATFPDTETSSLA